MNSNEWKMKWLLVSLLVAVTLAFAICMRLVG